MHLERSDMEEFRHLDHDLIEKNKEVNLLVKQGYNVLVKRNGKKKESRFHDQLVAAQKKNILDSEVSGYIDKLAVLYEYQKGKDKERSLLWRGHPGVYQEIWSNLKEYLRFWTNVFEILSNPKNQVSFLDGDLVVISDNQLLTKIAYEFIPYVESNDPVILAPLPEETPKPDKKKKKTPESIPMGTTDLNLFEEDEPDLFEDEDDADEQPEKGEQAISLVPASKVKEKQILQLIEKGQYLEAVILLCIKLEYIIKTKFSISIQVSYDVYKHPKNPSLYDYIAELDRCTNISKDKVDILYKICVFRNRMVHYSPEMVGGNKIKRKRIFPSSIRKWVGVVFNLPNLK